MSGPNISPGGKVTTPVLNIDIAPTLLDLAGVTTGAAWEMDGLSISPLVLPNNTEVDLQTNEISRVKREQAAAAGADLNNSTSSSLASPVSILSNYTGIQGRHNFLIEYSGEGAASTSSEACSEQLHGDLEDLAQCSQTFQCKCQDARNNTYTCLRSIGQEDSIFCQFEDRGNTMEMYNLAQDNLQLINLAEKISEQTINFYKVTFLSQTSSLVIFTINILQKKISLLTTCKGQDCNSV